MLFELMPLTSICQQSNFPVTRSRYVTSTSGQVGRQANSSPSRPPHQHVSRQRSGLPQSPPTFAASSLNPFARSAGVTAAADLHFVQHLPSKNWSNSGQSAGRHTTSRQRTGSALLFMGTPPERSLAHVRSSGTSTFSAQHSGQHVPASSGLTYLNGGLQSIALQAIPSHVSTEPAAPGE